LYGIDVGLKQRSTLLARAALCELLVLRLMHFWGAWRAGSPQHHATCDVSQRHFLVSKNLTPYMFDEGQRLYSRQQPNKGMHMLSWCWAPCYGTAVKEFYKIERKVSMVITKP
jgi:hypothetical protein